VLGVVVQLATPEPASPQTICGAAPTGPPIEIVGGVTSIGIVVEPCDPSLPWNASVCTPVPDTVRVVPATN